MKRIALFTHDTFGLGHVRRCLHIVRAFCRREPQSAVLLISGSPAVQAFRDLPPNADFVKLPTIVKTGAAESRPPHLPIGTREVTSLRKRILRAALESFDPDLFLVDNFPLGSRKELLPVLEACRRRSTTTVLGLRDIVDRPEVVRATWSKEGAYDVLAGLYDRILVYGVPQILDVVEDYALPDDVGRKVRYCGYVTAVPHLRPADDVRAELGVTGPLAVATVGGGGDGFPLLASFVEAAGRLPELSTLAVTGPLMGAPERERLRRLAARAPRLVILDYVSDLASYLAAADVVVAMGGYNTVAELLALGRRALVLPRNWRYGEFAQGTAAGLEWEQLLRARALERLGLLRVLEPGALEPETLAAVLAAEVGGRGPLTVPPIDVGGVENVVDELLDLTRSERKHAQA